MSKLQVSVTTIKHTNFGDHGERVRSDHEWVLGETIEELVLRVFPAISAPFQSHSADDVIELRVMVDRFGKVSGEPDTALGDAVVSVDALSSDSPF